MSKVKDNSRVCFWNLVPAAGIYVVDPIHSFAEFAVQHLIVGQIWERSNSISGKIRIADDPLLSTFELSVDQPASIRITQTVTPTYGGRDSLMYRNSASANITRLLS